MKRNALIAQDFVAGISSDSANLHSDVAPSGNGDLASYYTVIAFRAVRDGRVVILVNPTKYSVTTSTHQRHLANALSGAGYHWSGDYEMHRVGGWSHNAPIPHRVWTLNGDPLPVPDLFGEAS